MKVKISDPKKIMIAVLVLLLEASSILSATCSTDLSNPTVFQLDMNSSSQLQTVDPCDIPLTDEISYVELRADKSSYRALLNKAIIYKMNFPTGTKVSSVSLDKNFPGGTPDSSPIEIGFVHTVSNFESITLHFPAIQAPHGKTLKIFYLHGGNFTPCSSPTSTVELIPGGQATFKNTEQTSYYGEDCMTNEFVGPNGGLNKFNVTLVGAPYLTANNNYDLRCMSYNSEANTAQYFYIEDNTRLKSEVTSANSFFCYGTFKDEVDFFS